MDELPKSVEVGSLGSPHHVWAFLDGSERGVVRLRDVAIGRGVYQPGWRWSQDVQPLSGKESEEHIGYVISGRMAVRAKNGTEVEVGPGDAFVAAPGSDAWVVGKEPCVALDFPPTASSGAIETKTTRQERCQRVRLTDNERGRLRAPSRYRERPGTQSPAHTPKARTLRGLQNKCSTRTAVSTSPLKSAYPWPSLAHFWPAR
jgi:hypothetical protein